MEDDEYKAIISRLQNLESHLINLIIPIQNITKVLTNSADIHHLMEQLKKPLSVNDNNLQSLLAEMRKESFKFKDMLDKYSEITKENSTAELKFIGKKVNEIQSTLDSLEKKGINKEITLDFRCDGYELVKKPVNFHQEDQIEESDDEKITTLLKKLTKNERICFIHRLGILGVKKQTFKEIADSLYISTDTASLTYKKSLRKLKNILIKHPNHNIKDQNFLKEIYGDVK